MNFFIIPSGLVTGNYYNGEGASDINALKPGKSFCEHFVSPRQNNRGEWAVVT
jgi:hypothetical protein